MKSICTWFAVAGFALVALELFNPLSPDVLAADVTSTWSTAASGNWNVNANWTNVPALGGFPTNGNGGVATYDAAITPVGSPYTVTLNTDVTVANLLLSSANATLSHTTGILTATGAINLTAGTYSLAGGTIANSTVNATVPISLTGMGGTLSGLTINGDLRFLSGFNSKVVIAGGTTFSTAHMAGNYSTIGFAPAQTLSGTIQFEPGGDQSSVTMSSAGTLTIGTTGVIKTLSGLAGDVSIGSGAFAYNEAMALTNSGLISSQVSGRTLTINPATSFTNAATGTLEAKSGSILTIAPTGTWTNAGMISVNAATVNLGGTFNAIGGIGTWTNTGGTVNVMGIINAGGGANTLTLNNATGSWSMAGGTINGGTLAFADGKTLNATGMDGTLSGVTINGDLSFPVNFARALIAGGTTFTTAHLASNYSAIGFAPAQTLAGTIQFEGAGDQSSVTLGSAGTFTVGTTGVIKTLSGLTGNVSIGSGGFAYNAAMALTNNGLISSQVSGRTLTINPATSFTNSGTGTLEAKSGSILTIAPTGTWTNAGMISVNAATVNLGGTFNAIGGIGNWSNTGGTVNVTGTITNTGNTLTLNNATGSWSMAGGTINGGTLSFADSKTLNATGMDGTLSGVTINGDLSFPVNFARALIAGGTTFTTAHLASNYSAIGFAPAQTLAGTIQFEGAGDQSSVTLGSAGTFTVGTTGVIKTLSGLTGNVSIGSGGFAYNAAMALTNNGLISSQVSGRTLTINPATSFTNAGTLEAINGGNLSIPLGYTQTAGVTRLSGGSTISALNGITTNTITVAGGRLEGSGTITANVANSGTIAPGLTAGILAITGDVNLASASSLQIELGGTTPGTQYDQFHVAGQLALGGTLNVSVINSFNLAAGNLFDFFDWGSVSGKFSSVVLPPLSSPLAWYTSQLYNNGRVLVIDTNFFPGDFNRDGHVNAADLSAMVAALTDLNAYKSADSLTSAQLLSIGDIDLSGTVTNADVQSLLNLLKSGGGSLAAVPEPTSVVLLALTLPGLVFAVFCRRRR